MTRGREVFFRTYETEATIGEETDTLESLRQMRTETVNSVAYRIVNAAYSCQNVHTDTKKIYIFVLVLLPVEHPIVIRYRRKNPPYE